MTRPECEQFTGRKKAICEGTADLPLASINSYRQRWGLEPLSEVTPAVKAQRIILPRTGTSLPARRQALGSTQEAPPHYLNCPHRDEAQLMSVRGSIAGVGCSSGSVPVYNCNRFDEPVLKYAPERNLIKLQGVIAGYTGRTCRGCTVAAIASKLTICITHYRRPDALQRCLESLDTHYPDIPRLVQDTEGNLSRGRNLVIAKATTPYVMICEEDFEFDDRYNPLHLCEILDSDLTVGGASGAIRNVRLKDKPWNWFADLRRFRGKLHYSFPTEKRTSPSGLSYYICDLLPNAGVWRRSVFDECPWDEDLEVQEHHEWFWRLKTQENWRCAFVPSMSISHHQDRPSKQYRAMRGRRHFKSLAQSKIKAEFGTFRGFPLLQDGLPNIVVLGIGHSNTTITTRQLYALGWQTGDADTEYAESASVRTENERMRRYNKIDNRRLRQILAKLPQPWAIKDPRFAYGQLHRWIHPMEDYQPLLLWVVKDLETVKKSWDRRNENVTMDQLKKWFVYCQDQFNRWPWFKLKIRAEDIAVACRLFKELPSV